MFANQEDCTPNEKRWYTYVEVRDRTTRGDRTGDHFHELISGDTVAHTCEEQVGEGRDNTTEDKCDDVRPPGEGSVTLDDDNQT